MNNIIWVFGGSCSGKDNFIKLAKNNLLNDILIELNVFKNNILISNKSLDYISRAYDDTVFKKRDEIFEEISQLVKISDDSIIFIKGQDIDLDNDRVIKLCDKFPLCKHFIIFLSANAKVRYERSLNSRHWGGKVSIEELSQYEEEQILKLNKLNIKKIVIDSSTNIYKIISK